MATKKPHKSDTTGSRWSALKGLLGAIAEIERQQDGEELKGRTQYERIEQQHGHGELARSPLAVALVWIALGLGALAFAAHWWLG